MIEVMPSSVVRVETPDGTTFVTICEDGSGRPIMIDITIGKAGTALAAWASALSGLITAHLRNGGTLRDILYVLSGISSERQFNRVVGRPTAKSGPDGVAKAIIIYLMRRT